MFRTMLLYGSLSGIMIVASIVLVLIVGPDSSAASEWFGYLIMLVALSVIFIGVKRYRDRKQGGVIRFLHALGLGLGIAAVAAVFYVIGWEIYLASTDYSFMAEYVRGAIEAKRASGASAAEIDALQAEMDAMAASYANPLYRLPITFSEIFPVGAVVALVSAALLRNSGFLPARAV